MGKILLFFSFAFGVGLVKGALWESYHLRERSPWPGYANDVTLSGLRSGASPVGAYSVAWPEEGYAKGLF